MLNGKYLGTAINMSDRRKQLQDALKKLLNGEIDNFEGANADKVQEEIDSITEFLNNPLN